MGAVGQKWGGGNVGTWGGPWSHGYHYCPVFYVNTGLGLRGMMEERAVSGGGRPWCSSRFWALVSALSGRPKETLSTLLEQVYKQRKGTCLLTLRFMTK